MNTKIIFTTALLSCSFYSSSGQTIAARAGYGLQTVHPGQCKNTHIGCTGSCAERPHIDARIFINTYITHPNFLPIGSCSNPEMLRIIGQTDEPTADTLKEYPKTLSQQKTKAPAKVVNAENLFLISYQKIFYPKIFSAIGSVFTRLFLAIINPFGFLTV